MRMIKNKNAGKSKKPIYIGREIFEIRDCIGYVAEKRKFLTLRGDWRALHWGWHQTNQCLDAESRDRTSV